MYNEQKAAGGKEVSFSAFVACLVLADECSLCRTGVLSSIQCADIDAVMPAAALGRNLVADLTEPRLGNSTYLDVQAGQHFKNFLRGILGIKISNAGMITANDEIRKPIVLHHCGL